MGSFVRMCWGYHAASSVRSHQYKVAMTNRRGGEGERKKERDREIQRKKEREVFKQPWLFIFISSVEKMNSFLYQIKESGDIEK